jgi:hypothetical protein
MGITLRVSSLFVSGFFTACQEKFPVKHTSCTDKHGLFVLINVVCRTFNPMTQSLLRVPFDIPEVQSSLKGRS